MKLYTKKEKKLSGSFWEINILSEKLTTTDDGRRRTTDESALEKLRCLSAGGAKKRKSYWSVSEIGPSPPLKVDADAADDDGRVGIWKAPLPGGTAELKRRWTYFDMHPLQYLFVLKYSQEQGVIIFQPVPLSSLPVLQMSKLWSWFVISIPSYIQQWQLKHQIISIWLTSLL